MTRGKHAAQSATRRADAAETTLDRLIEEMHRWKRQALANKAAADLNTGLAKEVKRLREAVGIPVDEHRRAIDELTTAHHAERDRLEQALDVVLTKLGGLVERDEEGSWITVEFLDAIRVLPERPVVEMLRVLGFERDMRRTLLDPNTSERIRHDVVNPEVMQAMTLAANAGITRNRRVDPGLLDGRVHPRRARAVVADVQLARLVDHDLLDNERTC